MMKLPTCLNHGGFVQLPPTLISFCLFFASVQYCWVAERTQLFDKVSKHSDPRLFLLCVALSVLLALQTWAPITSRSVQPKSTGIISTSSLLSREQTEEWKGWMQMVILFYHYFGLSKNLPVYQVIRVLVATYIFLTGYGHTSYFLKTKDFSLDRTIKTLLRLNLLSGVLAYVTNRHWDFYYFPGLSSFWYVVVLITVRLARTASGSICLRRVCVNLLVSCAMVQLLLYTTIGNTISSIILELIGKVGGPHIHHRELIFRLRLDSIVPYIGSLLAVFIDFTDGEPAAWLKRRFCIGQVYICLVKTHTPWISLFIIVVYFLAVQQIKDKVISNMWHPFISIIPILAMFSLRNATSRLRQGFNRTFRWLGTVSLETYVLQSHIWLTNNNKELLHIRLFNHISSNPRSLISMSSCWLDMLIITITFLLTSHVTAYATKSLIDWLMAGSKKRLVVLLACCWMLNLHWKKLFS